MVQPPWLLYSEGVADVLVAVIAAVETTPTIHHCDMRGNNMERDTWDELHELLEERKNGAHELHGCTPLLRMCCCADHPTLRREAQHAHQTCTEQGTCGALPDKTKRSSRRTRTHDEL